MMRLSGIGAMRITSRVMGVHTGLRNIIAGVLLFIAPGGGRTAVRIPIANIIMSPWGIFVARMGWFARSVLVRTIGREF